MKSILLALLFRKRMIGIRTNSSYVGIVSQDGNLVHRQALRDDSIFKTIKEKSCSLSSGNSDAKRKVTHVKLYPSNYF